MPAHVRRNYGRAHQAQRQAWIEPVATGTVRCARADTGECLEADPYIHPDQSWQLDHIGDGTHPSHTRCNLSAGASYGNRLREPHSRVW
jgi:P2-related tail formation protein